MVPGLEFATYYCAVWGFYVYMKGGASNSGMYFPVPVLRFRPTVVLSSNTPLLTSTFCIIAYSPPRIIRYSLLAFD
jgi:hypothetical protein